MQVGHGKTGQPYLRLGSAPHRAFVANFATGASAGARERCNRCGVIVRLHLHQEVHRFLGKTVFRRLRVRVEAPRVMAGHDRGVIGIGGKYALAAAGIGIANHAEQRVILLYPVNRPAGIEDLVATVLGVGLRKHHQLDITGVAA